MSNLTCISSFFIVSNLKDSVSFYINKLGFEVRYIGPEGDPFFAIVGRDHIYIMFNTGIYLIGQILKGRYNGSGKLLEAGCGGGRNISWFVVQPNFDIYMQ